MSLWGNSRTTDSPGAATSPEFVIRLTPRPAACALARISLCLALLLLTACERAPSFDIVGSFFPAWLVCLALAIVLTAVARWLLARMRIVIAVPILTYPSLAALFTFALWLAFFR
ncbi:MAG TPA: YtcA family lipoprotein [Bryobacteraceae bacterium]